MAARPDKPRVRVTSDSTYAHVQWSPTTTPTSYTVRYARARAGGQLEAEVAIAELVVRTNEVLLTQLAPGTQYLVFVSAARLGAAQQSNQTIVRFETLALTVMDSVGSGSGLFDPAPAALGLEGVAATHALARGATGYSYDHGQPGLFHDGDFYQFAIFRLDQGRATASTHIDLQLSGASGTWPEAPGPSSTQWLDKTILLLTWADADGGVQPYWLNTNRLRVPGVVDLQDGARALERALGVYTWRVTFSAVNPRPRSFSGPFYVKVGITSEGNRCVAGVRMGV